MCKLLDKLTISDLKRFWSKVNIGGMDDCWEWSGGMKEGYGKFRLDGKKTSSHRISFAVANGGIPNDSEVILHSCDNRACVNPKHLSAGMVIDNVNDRNQKNRQAKGEKIWKSKISEKQVLEIRARYIPRVVTFKMLAEEYGLCLRQVYMIVSKKSCSHV